VIHEVVTEGLAKELKGTVVAIPTINPSGFRRASRSPEFDERDPNRLFPLGMFADKDEEQEEDVKYPKLFEQVAQQVYAHFEKYADYHIDFHNHTLRSIPYAIIDRIFYRDKADKEVVQALSKKQEEMVNAFENILITAEFPAKKYLKLKYYRTFSGATLNSLRIPAFTVELGAHAVVYPDIVAGSAKAIRNVLRWAGMLGGPKEEITEFLVSQPSERLRRCEHPRAKHSGILRFLVNPGEQVSKGQPIAKITDIFGRPLGDGYIRTDHDGYMIALRNKMTVYPNEAIAEMGIKDEEPLIAPIPSKE
ncbi:MAG: succinylglutamate desuccinylase/aspartoacylase family protein, partial [Candidatus Hodarchaeota archaeon]